MNKNSLVRITALWAFSEAFLGGILHGLKIPFTGLVLAFIASLCITIIAMADKKAGVILKATLVVISVKFVLSPYTPPMAYVAVLIQGLAGEVFFLRRKFIKVAAFSLSLFSLLYSAFQFLITITILFGKRGWLALDEFLNNITRSLMPSNQHYVVYLAIVYIGCYIIAGIVAGILSIKIIQQIQSGETHTAPHIISAGDDIFTIKQNNPNKTSRNKWMMLIGAGSFLVLCLTYLPAVHSKIIYQKKITLILSRGLLIVLSWTYLLSPILIKLMTAWANKFRNRNNVLFTEVIGLLPEIKNIIRYSWLQTGSSNRFSHFKKFISTAIWLTAFYEPDHNTNRAGTYR